MQENLNVSFRILYCLPIKYPFNIVDNLPDKAYIRDK